MATGPSPVSDYKGTPAPWTLAVQGDLFLQKNKGTTIKLQGSSLFSVNSMPMKAPVARETRGRYPLIARAKSSKMPDFTLRPTARPTCLAEECARLALSL